MNLLQLLTELLSYARKLLPLMELYAARRAAAPARDDAAAREFQQYAAEMLSEHRRELLELKSGFEALQQRLKLIDEQTVAAQRELARIADGQRTVMIVAVVAAVASIAAAILGLISVLRH